MRKGTTLKPKIWNSTAPLHFWDSEIKSNGTHFDADGAGVDPEQVAHGRVHPYALRGFDSFTPSMFGVSPREFRDLSQQRATGKKWW